MKKLTLKLDSLRVESFDTDAARREQGTVQAYAGTLMTCPVRTDPCLCDPFEPLTSPKECD